MPLEALDHQQTMASTARANLVRHVKAHHALIAAAEEIMAAYFGESLEATDLRGDSAIGRLKQAIQEAKRS